MRGEVCYNDSMPQVLKFLDQISREKQRAVLSVVFKVGRLDDRWVEYEDLPVRQGLITFLDENHISWEPCGGVADVCTMSSYRGQLYIDLPFDEGLPEYQKVRDHLEHPDGTMRFDDATFVYLPLDMAMKNAHHDAPGFWENWAENF